MAKFCQILTLFAQVMTSEAKLMVLIMADISAMGPKELNKINSLTKTLIHVTST